MQRPDHDVRGGLRRVADELVAGPIEREARGVDEHLVEDHVVGLAELPVRRERPRDRGVPGGEEVHARDGLEVAGDREVVADQERGQAPGIGRGQGGQAGPVAVGTEQVARAGGVALGGQRLGRVPVVVEVERIRERARHGARDAQRVAGREALGIVVGIFGEARVGAAVEGRAGAAEALLDAVAPGGVVEPHHHAGGGVARIAVQADVAVGEVDICDHAAHHLGAFLEEDVAGDDVAAVGAVGGDGGECARGAGVAAVGLGQATLAAGDALRGRPHEGLLEREAIGGEVDEQIAWDRDDLPAHDDGAARPHVSRVREGEPLDLAGDQRGGRGRACGP